MVKIEEGIARYTPVIIKFGGKDMIQYRQERSFGDQSLLLTNPGLVPLRIQDRIAEIGDVEIGGNIKKMFHVLGRPASAEDQEDAREELREFAYLLNKLGTGTLKEIYYKTLNDMSSIIKFGITKSIKLDARTREAARVAFIFGGSSALSSLRNQQVPIPFKRMSDEEIQNLSEDETFVVVNSAFYSAWEALTVRNQAGFGKNPFKPLINLIPLGFVGPNFFRKKNHEVIEIHEFEKTARRKAIRMVA